MVAQRWSTRQNAQRLILTGHCMFAGTATSVEGFLQVSSGALRQLSKFISLSVGDRHHDKSAQSITVRMYLPFKQKFCRQCTQRSVDRVDGP
jgi:hypothetical protein